MFNYVNGQADKLCEGAMNQVKIVNLFPYLSNNILISLICNTSLDSVKLSKY